ncbi:MAG: DUF4832 domain-containing protein [Lacunisphaera sp.]|nr:DUF4832 domain-containing protein [Lacunisphaera sp.]
MPLFVRRSSLLAAALLACLAPTARAATVRITPADTGEALVNPDMGWTLHFYSNLIENYGSKLEPSDTLDDWPGLSTVYLRVPWSFLEPKEGEFNWSLLDTPAQRWIAKGKRIALRVTSTESWLRHATPRWVQEAGARGIDFAYGKGPQPGGPLWEPDYLDPVFLEKLDHFLAALARRYDGNPNVAFIDIGSFGLWGEGHTVYSSRLNAEQTLAVVQRHIALHKKHFPRTLLALSDDVAGPDQRAPYPAMDHALAEGVTMRDDSILVLPPPKSWFHDDMAQAFWPHRPVILEHEHLGLSQGRKAWSGALLEKSVEDYHAAYLSIHWWPREFLAENREAIERINRRLGYRILLKEISFPAEARLGEPFTVATTWANAGVAPCYPGGFWSLTLRDANGGLASAQVDEGFDFRTLPVGPPGAAPEQKLSSRFTVAFPHVDPLGTHTPPTKPGVYDVFVSVGMRDGTPVIALPLSGHDGHRRYKVGQIVLKQGMINRSP